MGQEPLVSYSSWRAKHLNLIVSGLLSPLEIFLEFRARSDDGPVCFIIGPPRSGTTLLYELVVTRFQCGYFTNLAKRLFRVPVAATWLCRKEMRTRQGSFNSVYGELEGRAAPNEAGRIWAHWMPYAAPYFLNQPGLTPIRMRRKLAAIARISGQPMVIKNPILQSDMAQIVETFSNAVFLYIERDWADNARSLMKLRQDRTSGDHTGWVSLRPQGWEAYAQENPLTQSCAQVALSHKDIQACLSRPELAARTMKIGYERLCTDPDAVLSEVEDFLKENGIAVARNARSAEVSPMAPRTRPDDETQVQISACLQEISNEMVS